MITDSIAYYIVNFMPNGSVVGKDKENTDKIDYKGGDKKISMIKFLVQPLVKNMKSFAEKKIYFVIAMENNFTLPKEIIML